MGTHALGWEVCPLHFHAWWMWGCPRKHFPHAPFEGNLGVTGNFVTSNQMAQKPDRSTSIDTLHLSPAKPRASSLQKFQEFCVK